MATNGTVRPTISNSSNGQRQCSFFINAPADKLIQMKSSIISLKSSGAELAIYGGAEINVNPPAGQHVPVFQGRKHRLVRLQMENDSRPTNNGISTSFIHSREIRFKF
jgi:hypothetical protein